MMMPPLGSTESDDAVRLQHLTGKGGIAPLTAATTAGSGADVDAASPGAAEPREIHDSAVGAVTAERVTVHDALVGKLDAERVEAHDSLFLVASVGHIEGEGTRVLLMPRAALLLGIALGGTLLLGLRILGGRR